MESKQVFKQYYSRLVKEGIIKALICGFIIGFAASIIPAVISFLVNYNGIWISIGVGFAVGIAFTPLFYYAFFRPKTKKIAERIDRLGLDERLITMMELEKDESYIAMRQREDAKEKLNAVKRNRLKISIFKIPVIAIAVIAACSVSMITVSALSVEPMRGWTPPVPEILEANKNVYFSVVYLAGEGGYIDENSQQRVLRGENAATVFAIALNGYIFVEWSDGVRTAERTDKNVQEDISVSAAFAKVEISEGIDPPPGPDPGGEYIERNLILDNRTYYRDDYDAFYEEAMEIIDGGGEIPAYLKEFVEFYFKIIV